MFHVCVVMFSSPLHVQQSQASLKLLDYDTTISCTSEILDKWDEKNIKALYRRGCARMAQGKELHAAKNDFKRVLELDSSNLAAKRSLDTLTTTSSDNS